MLPFPVQSACQLKKERHVERERELAYFPCTPGTYSRNRGGQRSSASNTVTFPAE